MSQPVRSGSTASASMQGATGFLGEIDAHGSIHVRVRDPNASELWIAPTGSYMVPVEVYQTAATIAAKTVWSMFNAGGRTVSINRIRLLQGFDGIAVGTTTLRYSLSRFGAVPPTGGVTVGIVAKNSGMSGSVVTDARVLNTGLTTTSIVFENPFAVLSLPLAAALTALPLTGGLGLYVAHELVFGSYDQRCPALQLGASEGLAISTQTAATIIGSSLTGWIEWDER